MANLDLALSIISLGKWVDRLGEAKRPGFWESEGWLPSLNHYHVAEWWKGAYGESSFFVIIRLILTASVLGVGSIAIKSEIIRWLGESLDASQSPIDVPRGHIAQKGKSND